MLTNISKQKWPHKQSQQKPDDETHFANVYKHWIKLHRWEKRGISIFDRPMVQMLILFFINLTMQINSDSKIKWTMNNNTMTNQVILKLHIPKKNDNKSWKKWFIYTYFQTRNDDFIIAGYCAIISVKVAQTNKQTTTLSKIETAQFNAYIQSTNALKSPSSTKHSRYHHITSRYEYDKIYNLNFVWPKI